jgi:hypothetical protein
VITPGRSHVSGEGNGSAKDTEPGRPDVVLLQVGECNRERSFLLPPVAGWEIGSTWRVFVGGPQRPGKILQ